MVLVWSWSYGGFPATHWYPGALGIVLVLGALVFGLRPRIRDLAPTTQVALGALGLFTAWSFASISWADAQGVAWDGANRTLLYLAIFAIVALSTLDGPRALLVVGTWTLGILVLAVWVLIKLPDAVGPGAAVLGPGLAAPTGYANAEACLWLMAAWPALVLSSRVALPPALRGLFAGGAVVLFDIALLSESRGAIIAAGICLIVLLAAVPGRVRTVLSLVPVGIGLALTAPHVIDVSDARRDAGAGAGALAGLATPVLVAGTVVGVVVAVIALLERRRPPSAAMARRVSRAVGVAAALALPLAIAVLLAVGGNPVDSVNSRWESFKGGATPDTSTFGGARYDYYRVAADIIGDHPVRGVGADNFAHDYAVRGTALEFPAYVHSVELRTLVHTGIVGGLLLAIALGAVLFGSLSAVRAGSAAGTAAAVAAGMVFVHWFVQGSTDFFWEFPALGGAAFAMLGLVSALSPRRARGERAPAVRRSVPSRRRVGVAAGVALLLVASISLAAPWTSALETQRAGRIWPTDADAAYRQLDRAADLNPLSPQPALTKGTIALRLNRLDDARDAFAEALERDPREAYATLALGAIASQERGGFVRALGYMRRAVQLNPQDGVSRAALETVRSGKRIDIPALLRQYELLARDAKR